MPSRQHPATEGKALVRTKGHGWVGTTARQLAFTVCIAFGLPGAHADEITLPQDWRAGETATYVLETVTPPPGRPQAQPKTVRLSVAIQVLSADKEGSVHRWTFQPAVPEPVTSTAEEADVLARLKAIGPREVELQLTPQGEIADVRNLDALRRQRRQFDDFQLSLVARKLTPQQLDLLRETLYRTSNDAALLDQATREASIFYRATGGSFRPGSRRNERFEYPGPEGGVGVQTDASIEVSTLAADGTLTVTTIERIPQEDTAAAMALGANQILQAAGHDVPRMTEGEIQQSMGSSRFDGRVETEQVVRRGQRWPRAVSRREVISVDDATSLKSYRFELKATATP